MTGSGCEVIMYNCAISYTYNDPDPCSIGRLQEKEPCKDRVEDVDEIIEGKSHTACLTALHALDNLGGPDWYTISQKRLLKFSPQMGHEPELRSKHIFIRVMFTSQWCHHN